MKIAFEAANFEVDSDEVYSYLYICAKVGVATHRTREGEEYGKTQVRWLPKNSNFVRPSKSTILNY